MEWFWAGLNTGRKAFNDAFLKFADVESEPKVLQCVDETFTQQNFPEVSEKDLTKRRQTWAELLCRFQKYGHFSTGNLVSALEGGDACFTEMLKAISLSQSRVWCESYIFDNSQVAETFFTALLNAASRGLDVVLLVDYIGSFALRQDWVRELRQAGCDVVFFNPVLPASLCVGPISFRDHRKIMICDEVGFCGGMNIQEEVGEELFGTSRFYDVHAKLQGPCVADLAEVFRDSLKEAGGHVVRNPIDPPARIEPGVYVQILQSNVRQRRRTLQKVMAKSIDAAHDSVLLTTASKRAYDTELLLLEQARPLATSRGRCSGSFERKDFFDHLFERAWQDEQML